MSRPLVRSWWRFRYYPYSARYSFGWRQWGWRPHRDGRVFDFGPFAYVREDHTNQPRG